MQEEEVRNALVRCAVGFGTNEVTEEYAEVGGEWKLVKKKVIRRDIPPDIKAVKMIMDEQVTEWDDEQLEQEKQRLLSLLKGE